MNALELNKRIDVLDYLRGFALMGIILVNILPLLEVTLPDAKTTDAAYLRFLYLFVEGRFYTIFTFLFGVGFYLFITRANAKGKNGYILFLRRILALFIFGLVHVQYHPGEALTVYAIGGLFILPFYKANKLVNLLLGTVMLLGLSVFSSKIYMIFPIMLLGIAAGQYRVFEGIAQNKRKVAIFTGIMFIFSVVGLIYQFQNAPFLFGLGTEATFIQTRRFILIGITIGPIVSAFYVGLMILLLQLPLVRKVLSPLKSYGRMALTNYVTQTAFILLAGKALDLFNQITYLQSLYLCLAIYVIQLVFSTIWLRFFKFGPLEWLWRVVTYFELPPLRR
jgi:uncharacterized membrane protein YeiB